jgi:hypothetical protein
MSVQLLKEFALPIFEVGRAMGRMRWVIHLVRILIAGLQNGFDKSPESS